MSCVKVVLDFPGGDDFESENISFLFCLIFAKVINSFYDQGNSKPIFYYALFIKHSFQIKAY